MCCNLSPLRQWRGIELPQQQVHSHSLEVAQALTPPPRIYANVWQWCELIASEYGPPAHTTRLVLLVLSLNMNRDRSVAWPSQKKIASRSGLAPRTVKFALQVARETGWVQVAATVDTDSGLGWRGNEYTATVPAELAPHIPNFDLVANRPVEGGAYDGTRVGHGMPPESPNESPNESSERAPGKGGAPYAPPSGAQSQKPDELKTRISEGIKTAQALRQSAGAALARPVGPVGGNRKLQPITDSELAAKVRALRSAGHDDALIKRQLSAQAAEPQLARVLKRA